MERVVKFGSSIHHADSVPFLLAADCKSAARLLDYKSSRSDLADSNGSKG
jgi:hypothetical protein